MSDVPHITQNFARPSYRPQPQQGLIDPDMRRMAIVAAGFGGVLAAAVALLSLSHHAHHGVPVIVAASGPVRIKPSDPGGMKVAGAEEISSGAERLAPEPEKPALHALRAKSHPVAHPAEQAEAAHPAAPVVAPSPPVEHASATAKLPVPEARGTAVQLAAFETQLAAEQDWGKLSEKMPALLNGRRPEVERAEVAGHVVYRLRTGGFASLTAARDFCVKVQDKGGDCTVAAF